MSRIDRLGNIVLPGIGGILPQQSTSTPHRNVPVNSIDSTTYMASITLINSNVCAVKTICSKLQCTDVHRIEQYLMNLCCVSPNNQYIFIASTYKVVYYPIDSNGVVCNNHKTLVLPYTDNGSVITNIASGYIDRQPVLCILSFTGYLIIYRINDIHNTQPIVLHTQIKHWNDNSAWSISISPFNATTSYIAVGTNAHRTFIFSHIFTGHIQCNIGDYSHRNNIPCIHITGEYMITASVDCHVRIIHIESNHLLNENNPTASQSTNSFGWCCSTIDPQYIHQSYITYMQYLLLTERYEVFKQHSPTTSEPLSFIQRALLALQRNRTPLDIVNELLSHNEPIDRRAFISERTHRLLEQSLHARHTLQQYTDSTPPIDNTQHISTDITPTTHNTNHSINNVSDSIIADNVSMADAVQTVFQDYSTVHDQSVQSDHNNTNNDNNRLGIIDDEWEFEFDDDMILTHDDTDILTDIPAEQTWLPEQIELLRQELHNHTADELNDVHNTNQQSNDTQHNHEITNANYIEDTADRITPIRTFNNFVLYSTQYDLYLLDSQLNTLYRVPNAAHINAGHQHVRIQFINCIPELSIVLVAAKSSERVLIYHIIKHTDQYSMQFIGYIPESMTNSCIVGIHLTQPINKYCQLSDQLWRLYIVYSDCTVSCYSIQQHIDHIISIQPNNNQVTQLYQIISQSNVL